MPYALRSLFISKKLSMTWESQANFHSLYFAKGNWLHCFVLIEEKKSLESAVKLEILHPRRHPIVYRDRQGGFPQPTGSRLMVCSSGREQDWQ